MTNTAAHNTVLSLDAGFDRSLAWAEGGSVRYLVTNVSADGSPASAALVPALNLALCIDVSGSMAGEKLEAARATAIAVAQALTPRDRLTVVAFSNTADLLLDACAMDTHWQARAVAAIQQLETRGNTNLWEGWLLAAERVAIAMNADPRASHRVLLLSDGMANAGVSNRSELARHAGELLARGVVTSAVGIGDDYDEGLLGAMTEAGGGRLHDAEHAREIGEVVLGELLEGRTALLERTTLRFTIPLNVRAEVVGAWSQTVLPGAVEVLAGMLLLDSPKSIVLRLHCPAGKPGEAIVIAVSAKGVLPDGSGEVEALPAKVALQLAHGRDNNAQSRDIGRSGATFTAWRAAAMRRAIELNRDGDRRGAKHYLERELKWLEPYARGLPATETALAELVLLLRRADEELDPRLSKDIFMSSLNLSRSQSDLRKSRQSPDLIAKLRR